MPWSDIPERRIPLQNMERVVELTPGGSRGGTTVKSMILESNPTFGQNRGTNERERAYLQQTKPTIRVTPPKGRNVHVSPVKVGGDSVLMDRSLDAVVRGGNDGSGLLYPPR